MKWVRQFKGHDTVHNEQSGRPSVVNELVRAVDEVKGNRKFTMNPLALEFPQVSQTVI